MVGPIEPSPAARMRLSPCVSTYLDTLTEDTLSFSCRVGPPGGHPGPHATMGFANVLPPPENTSTRKRGGQRAPDPARIGLTPVGLFVDDRARLQCTPEGDDPIHGRNLANKPRGATDHSGSGRTS